MNKLYLLFTFLFSITSLYSQNPITEENYLKGDSILWSDYEIQQQALSRIWKAMPEKRDSIQRIYNDIDEKASRENIRLAMKYASVPSGLQRLYMTRLKIPKDTLREILNSLSAEMQESFYGKSINEHLSTSQIQEGDSVYRFPCIQADGTTFDWNITNGKQLLMLYGGLGCIGKEGRRQLEQLYNQSSTDNFLIIVYWPCRSLEKLQAIKQKYPFDYLFISDFKQDASPMKIKYGAQATPTCFLTDKQHTVKVKCTGLRTDLFNKYINHNE